jgi:hypothetical protein
MEALAKKQRRNQDQLQQEGMALFNWRHNAFYFPATAIIIAQ